MKCTLSGSILPILLCIKSVAMLQAMLFLLSMSILIQESLRSRKSSGKYARSIQGILGLLLLLGIEMLEKVSSVIKSSICQKLKEITYHFFLI